MRVFFSYGNIYNVHKGREPNWTIPFDQAWARAPLLQTHVYSERSHRVWTCSGQIWFGGRRSELPDIQIQAKCDLFFMAQHCVAGRRQTVFPRYSPVPGTLQEWTANLNKHFIISSLSCKNSRRRRSLEKNGVLQINTNCPIIFS